MADGAADDHRPDTAATVRTKPLKSNASTLADDAGAKWRPPFWCRGIAACLIDVECDLVTRVKNQQLLRCSASAKPQACLSMCGCTLNCSRHRCFVPERCKGTHRAGIACYANGQALACVYFEDATLHG
jgi:hypothetical protein